MNDLRYLKRRRQTWYFRLSVPADLQGSIRPGRKVAEIVETLGTTDLRVAQSKRWAHRDHWEREFQRLRGQTPDTPVRPPRDVYQSTLEHAVERRLAVEAREEEFSEWDVAVDVVLEQAMNRLGAVDTSELRNLPPDLQARWDALQDYRAMAKGKPPKHGQHYTMTFREAADGFLREAGKAITRQTIGQYEATLRLFCDFVGNKPVGAVTRADVARFLDEVERFHPHWGRSPKTKERSFQELREMFANGGEDAPGLSNRTLNRYLTTVSGAWKWAKDRGEATGEDPTADLFRPTTGKHSFPYQPYPPELLNRLFEAPRPKAPVLWELPLVGLFTGMRLNEICSLDWRDVQEEDGITFFDITAAKSEAGVRKVPVHPRLSWLLDRRKQSGPIWPVLKPGGPDEKRSWYFSKQFVTFRRDRGIDGPGLKFHSFRKNAVQCLERARVPQNEAAEIIGHEKASFTYRVYNPDGLTMAQRLEVVEKIQYPAVRLPRGYGGEG